ncbi:ATP-binding protein [Puteibacter caeruleilacunae]|nr:ATP-binding protein [Puteibacter caeruleilacunae]
MKELALHILDIAQNSIKAEADLVEIKITEDKVKDIYQIEIIDDGKGMDNETLQKSIDPFFTSRTTRKVGLGLSMFKQNAEQTGGNFQISSEPGKGCYVNATFGHKHFDRPVLGDIAGTVLILAISSPETEFKYTHQTADGLYEFDTREVKQELEGVPLQHPDIKKYLEDMIHENLLEIRYSK